MRRGHFLVTTAGGSAKHYNSHLGTVDAGRSGYGIFDDAGIPHQLSIFHVPATSRSKVGDWMNPLQNFGPTRGAPCWVEVPYSSPPNFFFL
jgi:hypothetical protein